MTDLYRIVTKRLPPGAFYAFCERWVPRIVRAQRLPLFGGLLRVALPISEHAKPGWRALDTYDWYAPEFQPKHDYRELETWLAAERVEYLRRLGVPVAVHGTSAPGT